MAEAATTTWEEASECPKCKQPGEDRTKFPAGGNLPRGTMVHNVYCMNPRCEWYNTPWMVQTNPDGSVPAPTDHTGKPKLYVGFEEHDQRARDLMAQIRQGVQRESDLSVQEGGYEIRKRRGPDL
jgi:hypothetical protein